MSSGLFRHRDGDGIVAPEDLQIHQSITDSQRSNADAVDTGRQYGSREDHTTLGSVYSEAYGALKQKKRGFFARVVSIFDIPSHSVILESC
jgi:hypothetical protein